MAFPLELRFSNDELIDYPLDAVIDFSEIIYANIVVEKPYVVYHEDSLNEVVEEKREVHPAFMDLEDLIKMKEVKSWQFLLDARKTAKENVVHTTN